MLQNVEVEKVININFELIDVYFCLENVVIMLMDEDDLNLNRELINMIV